MNSYLPGQISLPRRFALLYIKVDVTNIKQSISPERASHTQTRKCDVEEYRT